MKKKSNLNILAKLRLLLTRIRISLFIVVVVAGLLVAVVILSDMLEKASDTSGYTSPLKIQEIDQATMDRIQTLHNSNESFADPAIPSGRINPFAE